MRIAEVSPLVESVPPQLYGGTERVVYGLTEELVRRGHEVTLFASGDSRTSARLVPCCPQALRLDKHEHDPAACSIVELGMVCERVQEFDLIHNHIDYFAFPFARLTPNPMLTTTHGRLDLPETRRVFESFSDAALVSISDAQRAPLPHARWLGTVYHGIDVDHFTLREQPGDYLAFLGRLSPEKRPDRAIEIARDIGMRLLIAAKVDPADRDYYEHAIKPLLHHPLVEFIGEIDESQKDEFLGNAYAYLFPIDWPEPFGITMVEAMACGTPVIAMSEGSVPEVVEHGVTGFVCHTLRDMVEAVEKVPSLCRHVCRERALERFSVGAMADGYETIFHTMMANQNS